MNQSLFTQWVNTYFKPLITKIVEKVNGDEKQLTYMHKSLLTPAYSTTLKWGTIAKNGRVVAADVVSMDSSLPLKKRDAISTVEGDIPKVGQKRYLNERTMTDLDILVRTNGDGDKKGPIIQKLFGDTKAVIEAVWETMEFMFLQALSSGVTVISDDDNVGNGIRIDFNHPDANKFGAEVKWSDIANATPVSDITRVTDRAEQQGHSLQVIMMDRATWNNFRNNAEVKQLYAANVNIPGSNIPSPTLKQVNEAMEANHSLTIQIINRTVTVERDGVRKVLKPWEAGMVVLAPSGKLGSLVWGTLAEENHPDKKVTYQKADSYILVSKYAKNDPIREFTSSQALAVPVIDEIESIYHLDSEEAQAETQVEGNTGYEYNGQTYLKTSVITAINLATDEYEVAEPITDAELQDIVNQLSEEEIAIFEANITLGGV